MRIGGTLQNHGSPKHFDGGYFRFFIETAQMASPLSPEHFTEDKRLLQRISKPAYESFEFSRGNKQRCWYALHRPVKSSSK